MNANVLYVINSLTEEILIIEIQGLKALYLRQIINLKFNKMKIIKIDSKGKECLFIKSHHSVLIDTKQGFNVWVDVWLEDEELTADWNKYIFFLNNEEDLKIKKFQEDCNNFEEATSLAILAIEYYNKHKN